MSKRTHVILRKYEEIVVASQQSVKSGINLHFLDVGELSIVKLTGNIQQTRHVSADKASLFVSPVSLLGPKFQCLHLTLLVSEISRIISSLCCFMTLCLSEGSCLQGFLSFVFSLSNLSLSSISFLLVITPNMNITISTILM